MNKSKRTQSSFKAKLSKASGACLETAVAPAIDGHQGQRDRRRSSCFMHPSRIMMAMNNLPAKAAAILHDMVEDTSTSLDDLRRAGIPEKIISAVDALTKRFGESHAQYLVRIEANPIARMVTAHHLVDTLREHRLDSITDHKQVKMARYRIALKRLTQSMKGGRS